MVSGSVWGLQAQLNCREISSLNQFELINQRNATDNGTILRCPPITLANSPGPDYDGLPDICDFDAYLLDSLQYEDENWATLEQNFGTFPTGRMEIAVSYNKYAYEDQNSFIDLRPATIGAALWQNPIELVDQYRCKAMQDLLSNDLGTTVDGIQQKLLVHPRDSFVEKYNATVKTLQAIGIQCKSAFLTGTATIDGPSGTYKSFTIEAPDAVVSGTPIPLPIAIPRLFHSRVQAALDIPDGYTLEAFRNISDTVIDWTNFDVYGQRNPTAFIASNATWLQSIYRSVDAYYQQPVYCDPRNITTTSWWQQMQLINSTQVLDSLLRVYKAYAIEMTKSHRASFAGNLTAVHLTAIISPGVLHPALVTVLLAIWTICSTTLGLIFGLRPRWSETLDGFSMFRFGSDNPRFSAKQALSAQGYLKCKVLATLPGMVGDAVPDEPLGHISLVGRDGVAGRKKKYL